MNNTKHHLSNLLARIHRDGGHYEAEHGTERAAMDADFLVVAQNVMLGELEVIKAERDEWKARCEFSFEQRDKLTAERDALKTSNDSYITLANTAYELTEQRTAERDAAREAVISNCARVMTVTAERDALKDAARLALDALNTCETEGEQVRYSTYDTESVGSAIAALKAVL